MLGAGALPERWGAAAMMIIPEQQGGGVGHDGLIPEHFLAACLFSGEELFNLFTMSWTTHFSI